MAIKTCGFEGGTLGASVGTSAGDATPIFDGASAGFVFDNVNVHRGSRSAKLPSSAVGTQRLRWDNGTSKSYKRAYIYIDTYPSGDSIMTWTADAGSASSSTRAYLTAANKVRLGSKSGANIANAPASFPLNQWVRLEHYVEAGTSPSDGVFHFAYYLGNSTTAEWDSGALTTNTADSTGIIAEDRFAAATTSNNWWLDGLKVKTGADAVWGTDVAANVLPNLSITGNQSVTAGATVNLTATASDDDGSVASYAWSYASPSTGSPTLTGASTASISFTAGTAGNLYTLQCIVTDNEGGQTTRTSEVRVPVTSGSSLRHLALAGEGAGTWTQGGTPTSDGAAVNDETDTTYLESPTLSGTETTRKVRLQPTPARSSYVLKERLWLDAAGTSTVKVRLIEGASTVRQEWTQAVTTTPTEYTFSTTTPGAIVDPGFLSVEISAVS